MKKVKTNLRCAALLCGFLLLAAFTAQAQVVNIPDANFKRALFQIGVDVNHDSLIQVSEALVPRQLNLINRNIVDLTGIQSFRNLSYLDCSDNQLPVLNVQGMTNLQYLYCFGNQLATLNLQGLTNLLNCYCNNNRLTTLNVQGATALQTLRCYQNQLPSLNVQGLANLENLDCNNNQLVTLNVQGATSLLYLTCNNNQLATLNVQGLPNLDYLECRNNRLTALNLQGLTSLQGLSCQNNQLTTLNIQGSTSLRYLYCQNNPLACFSFLPNSLAVLNADSTNVICLPNRPTSLSTTLPLCQPNNINGCFASARIYGVVTQSANCVSTNIIFPNMLVTAANTTTGEQYVTNTNASGAYEIGVPNGVYSVSVVLPSNYWERCPNANPITITQVAQQVNRDILVNAAIPCTDMSIDHAVRNITRPCSTATMVVYYANRGTIASLNTYAELTLAPQLTLSSASIAYTALGNNIYRFALGTVNVLEQSSFTLNLAIACNVVMNQVLCTRAEIFPHTYCNSPALTDWDGSDVAVSGRYIGNNQARFALKNIGASPMTTALPYWVVEDNILVQNGSFQLASGSIDSLTITANPNKIYRMIANEAAANPARNTQETALLWNQSSNTNAIHWNFLNQHALNSGSSFVHQLCTAVRTSFDPNDISAVPEGVQNEHFITKGTELEYTIRFQNTGNDTAFVVRLLNALPQELDKTTLKIGASSHPMTYSLKGNGVLEFLYTNILLPDSTTNEEIGRASCRERV